MRMDKKVLSGKVRLVLLERLGSGIVVSKYPLRTLESSLREHLA
jgi:3-dehydroquinate synthetase